MQYDRCGREWVNMNLLRKFHFGLCGLLLLLLQLSLAQEVSFRITPLRPVEELRADAVKAQPPLEPGTFLKPDLVELGKLDPAIKLDIRYATTNNFQGTPVYTQARAFLQQPASEALLRAHRELQAQGYGLIILIRFENWQGSEDARRLRRNDRSRLCRLRRWQARGACSPCPSAPSHGKTGFPS
jgi:D-ala-D-ala dipeptidase